MKKPLESETENWIWNMDSGIVIVTRTNYRLVTALVTGTGSRTETGKYTKNEQKDEEQK